MHCVWVKQMPFAVFLTKKKVILCSFIQTDTDASMKSCLPRSTSVPTCMPWSRRVAPTWWSRQPAAPSRSRSLQGHIVVPDQFIDRTYKRIQTYYDGEEGSPKGISHIAMHSPFCERTREVRCVTIVKKQLIFFLGGAFYGFAERPYPMKIQLDIIKGITSIYPFIIAQNQIKTYFPQLLLQFTGQ